MTRRGFVYLAVGCAGLSATPILNPQAKYVIIWFKATELKPEAAVALAARLQAQRGMRCAQIVQLPTLSEIVVMEDFTAPKVHGQRPKQVFVRWDYWLRLVRHYQHNPQAPAKLS